MIYNIGEWVLDKWNRKTVKIIGINNLWDYKSYNVFEPVEKISYLLPENKICSIDDKYDFNIHFLKAALIVMDGMSLDNWFIVKSMLNNNKSRDNYLYNYKDKIDPGEYYTADENEKLAIHWCMLMLAYPIFLDVVFTIGKLIDLQNGFSLSIVRRRIFEIWGERSTLKYAIGKIVRSITEWGIIEDGDKSGDYKRKEQFIISSPEVKFLLIEAYLTASKRAYLQFIEVNKLHELFPFKLDLRLEDFHNSEIFSLNKMGMDIVIGLEYKR
ncbi:MAG TPA: hypothetical protein GX527_05990 [Clostridiaceae bacterium]|nr:hypothetical protein [Clostridiaceae bacterium]